VGGDECGCGFGCVCVCECIQAGSGDKYYGLRVMVKCYSHKVGAKHDVRAHTSYCVASTVVVRRLVCAASLVCVVRRLVMTWVL
jgi:hypothetical protein